MCKKLDKPTFKLHHVQEKKTHYIFPLSSQ